MIYSAIKKKNEIMPFAATCMDLEIIILREASQRKINILLGHEHVESNKKWYKRIDKTGHLGGCARSKQKFQGQGLNPYYGSDPGHGDNVGSLTIRPPGSSCPLTLKKNPKEILGRMRTESWSWSWRGATRTKSQLQVLVLGVPWAEVAERAQGRTERCSLNKGKLGVRTILPWRSSLKS